MEKTEKIDKTEKIEKTQKVEKKLEKLDIGNLKEMKIDQLNKLAKQLAGKEEFEFLAARD